MSNQVNVRDISSARVHKDLQNYRRQGIEIGPMKHLLPLKTYRLILRKNNEMSNSHTGGWGNSRKKAAKKSCEGFKKPLARNAEARRSSENSRCLPHRQSQFLRYQLPQSGHTQAEARPTRISATGTFRNLESFEKPRVSQSKRHRRHSSAASATGVTRVLALPRPQYLIHGTSSLRRWRSMVGVLKNHCIPACAGMTCQGFAQPIRAVTGVRWKSTAKTRTRPQENQWSSETSPSLISGSSLATHTASRNTRGRPWLSAGLPASITTSPSLRPRHPFQSP